MQYCNPSIWHSHPQLSNRGTWMFRWNP